MRFNKGQEKGIEGLASLFPYILPEGATPSAYSEQVAYFHDAGSRAELDKRSRAEGRACQLTPTSLSLVHGGVYVGLMFRNAESPATENGWTRAKFSEPHALDESAGGELPPITTSYPRVTLPADEPSHYGILLTYSKSEGVMGMQSLKLEFRVNGDGDILFPEDFPPAFYEHAEKALSAFPKEGLYHHQGRYQLNIEAEMFPSARIRIDGGMPVSAIELSDSNGGGSYGMHDFIKYFGKTSTKKEDPFKTHTGTGMQYLEIGGYIRHDGEDDGNWVMVDKVTLRSPNEQNAAEAGSLTYNPISRTQSVSETFDNPYLGMVEVQVDIGCQVKSASLAYIPEKVLERLAHPLEDFGVLKSMSLFDSTMRGVSMGSITVTGKTTIGVPHTIEVRPLESINIIDHLHTFRFCLAHDHALSNL